MTTLKLTSVSKPVQGEMFKQEFTFDADVKHNKEITIKYFDKTIDSETHVFISKEESFIKNKNLTINLGKNPTEAKIKTAHGEMTLVFKTKNIKHKKNQLMIRYSIYSGVNSPKISDNLIKYEWGK